MTSLNSLFIRDTAIFAILNAYTYVDNFGVTKTQKKNIKRPQQFDVFLFWTHFVCLREILSLSLDTGLAADADGVAVVVVVFGNRVVLVVRRLLFVQGLFVHTSHK